MGREGGRCRVGLCAEVAKLNRVGYGRSNNLPSARERKWNSMSCRFLFYSGLLKEGEGEQSLLFFFFFILFFSRFDVNCYVYVVYKFFLC